MKINKVILFPVILNWSAQVIIWQFNTLLLDLNRKMGSVGVNNFSFNLNEGTQCSEGNLLDLFYDFELHISAQNLSKLNRHHCDGSYCLDLHEIQYERCAIIDYHLETLYFQANRLKTVVYLYVKGNYASAIYFCL